MSTDEYKTCQCEECGIRYSIDRVHDIDNMGGEPDCQKWMCRRCILEKMRTVRCRGCGSRNKELYEIYENIFCARCIASLPTARKAIPGNYINNRINRLSHKPEINTEAEWKKLSGEGA